MKEIIENRTAKSKTFEIVPGRYKKVIKQEFIHVPSDPLAWKNKQHFEWQDIDLSFEDRELGWGVRNSWYSCNIKKDDIHWQYNSKIRGHVDIKLVSMNNQDISRWPTVFSHNIANNRIVFENLVPDLDIIFEARKYGLFVFKLLKGVMAPREFGWEILYDKDSQIRINTETAGLDNYNAVKKRERNRIEMEHNVAREEIGNKIKITFNEKWTGRTFTRDEERILKPVDSFVYPVLIDQDITENINANIDDGQRGAPGYTSWQYTNSVYLVAGLYVNYSYFPGWRFTTIGLDGSENIDRVELVLQAGGATGSPTMVIRGYDTDDASPFATSSVLPGDDGLSFAVTKTTANVDFTDGGQGEKRVDVTNIVLEILARPGWSSGNDMAFVGGEFTGGTNDLFYFYDYQYSSSLAASLEIFFTKQGVSLLPLLRVG